MLYPIATFAFIILLWERSIQRNIIDKESVVVHLSPPTVSMSMKEIMWARLVSRFFPGSSWCWWRWWCCRCFHDCFTTHTSLMSFLCTVKFFSWCFISNTTPQWMRCSMGFSTPIYYDDCLSNVKCATTRLFLWCVADVMRDRKK